MEQMPNLKVVQTLTAGFDLVRPQVPEGAVLCNARGVHDASTAEWVNAARGALVVTDDLVAELRSGRLSAALDVTEPEPLGPGHPLWALPSVLITPHVGASAPYSAAAALSFVRAQAERYVAGKPLANVIVGDY